MSAEKKELLHIYIQMPAILLVMSVEQRERQLLMSIQITAIIPVIFVMRLGL